MPSLPPYLGFPTDGPVEDKKFWEGLPPADPLLEPAMARITELRDRHGLTVPMVVRDFLSRRIAPLQARERWAWEYRGPNDDCRLAVGAEGDLSERTIAGLLYIILGSTEGIPSVLPSADLALCNSPRRDAIITGYPYCDAWGPRKDSPRANRPTRSSTEAGGSGASKEAGEKGKKAAARGGASPSPTKGGSPPRSKGTRFGWSARPRIPL